MNGKGLEGLCTAIKRKGVVSKRIDCKGKVEKNHAKQCEGMDKQRSAKWRKGSARHSSAPSGKEKEEGENGTSEGIVSRPAELA